MNTSFKEACACVLLEPPALLQPLPFLARNFRLFFIIPATLLCLLLPGGNFREEKEGEVGKKGRKARCKGERGGGGLLYVRGSPSGLGQEMKLHFPYLIITVDFGCFGHVGPLALFSSTLEYIQTKPLPEIDRGLPPFPDSLNPWLAGSRAAHCFLAFPERTLLLKRRGGGAAVRARSVR